MKEYIVKWVNVFEANCPRDAAKQACAAIDDAQRNPKDGPSVLLVFDEDDNLLVGYDEWGQGRAMPGDEAWACNDEWCYCGGPALEYDE